VITAATTRWSFHISRRLPRSLRCRVLGPAECDEDVVALLRRVRPALRALRGDAQVGGQPHVGCASGFLPAVRLAPVRSRGTPRWRPRGGSRTQARSSSPAPRRPLTQRTVRSRMCSGPVHRGAAVGSRRVSMSCHGPITSASPRSANPCALPVVSGSGCQEVSAGPRARYPVPGPSGVSCAADSRIRPKNARRSSRSWHDIHSTRTADETRQAVSQSDRNA